MSIKDSVSRLYERVASSGIPKNEIARGTGLHPNTLTKIGRPDWSPNTETLAKIEAFLNSMEGSQSPH